MSSIMTLNPGDVILTGTPKGVGIVNPGDIVECWCSINGKELSDSHMKFNVAEKPGFYVFHEE